jgi:hypothetical protein
MKDNQQEILDIMKEDKMSSMLTKEDYEKIKTIVSRPVGRCSAQTAAGIQCKNCMVKFGVDGYGFCHLHNKKNVKIFKTALPGSCESTSCRSKTDSSGFCKKKMKEEEDLDKNEWSEREWNSQEEEDDDDDTEDTKVNDEQKNDTEHSSGLMPYTSDANEAYRTKYMNSVPFPQWRTNLMETQKKKEQAHKKTQKEEEEEETIRRITKNNLQRRAAREQKHTENRDTRAQNSDNRRAPNREKMKFLAMPINQQQEAARRDAERSERRGKK